MGAKGHARLAGDEVQGGAVLSPRPWALPGHLHGTGDLGWGFAWCSSAWGGFVWGGQGAGGGALGRHEHLCLHLHIGVVAYGVCVCAYMYVCAFA